MTSGWKRQSNCFITRAVGIFMDKTHQFSLIWRKEKWYNIMKHKKIYTHALYIESFKKTHSNGTIINLWQISKLSNIIEILKSTSNCHTTVLNICSVGNDSLDEQPPGNYFKDFFFKNILHMSHSFLMFPFFTCWKIVHCFYLSLILVCWYSSIKRLERGYALT